VIGAAFFDETPDLVTLAGCFTIVLARIASIRLERRACAHTHRPRSSDQLG
jgi:hypothetical protein